MEPSAKLVHTFKYKSQAITYDFNNGRLSVAGKTYKVLITENDVERDAKQITDKTLVKEVIESIKSLFDNSQFEFDTLDGFVIDQNGIIDTKEKDEKRFKYVKPDELVLKRVSDAVSKIFLTNKLEPIKETKKIDRNIEATTHKVSIPPNPNTPEFQKFAVQNVTNENKKTLHEKTLQASNFADREITYANFSQNDQEFRKVLGEKMNDQTKRASKTDHWFDYADQKHFYFDFANANQYGGGYQGNGNVQEERMFLEVPALAFLGYHTQNKIHVTANGKENGDPTPFIVQNVQREFILTENTYGQGLDRVDENSVAENDTSVPVHIIGAAAKQYRGEGKAAYSESDLKYHLKAAFLAFQGAKSIEDASIIHSGLWGCGLFGNGQNMMVAIQILAAKIAGVEIVFDGVGAVDVNGIETEINQQINEGKTNEAILKSFATKNEDDWKHKG